jgi:hypothetical protein
MHGYGLTFASLPLDLEASVAHGVQVRGFLLLMGDEPNTGNGTREMGHGMRDAGCGKQGTGKDHREWRDEPAATFPPQRGVLTKPRATPWVMETEPISIRKP